MAKTEEGGNIDTINRFLVGLQGNTVVVQFLRSRLSRAEALNLAAYLVALADPSGEEFPALLQKIKET